MQLRILVRRMRIPSRTQKERNPMKALTAIAAILLLLGLIATAIGLGYQIALR